MQERGDRLGRLARPVLQRARAANPEQVLHILGDLGVRDGDLEIELGHPLRTPGRAHPPRVALVLQVLQHPGRLDRERGLDQHLVPPHPVDVVDVLDVDRALLHTCTAVSAGPEHVRINNAIDV